MNNDIISEKTILDIASQLLSVLQYLHSKNYLHAPGGMNSDKIYFTQSYDQIYMDIGKRSLSVTSDWLYQNSQSLLMNRKYFIKYCSIYWKLIATILILQLSCHLNARISFFLIQKQVMLWMYMNITKRVKFIV